jgi:hypothetical protein
MPTIGEVDNGELMSQSRARMLLWSPVGVVLALAVLFTCFPESPVLAGVTALPGWVFLYAFAALVFALASVAGWRVVRHRHRSAGAAALAGAAVGATPGVVLALLFAGLTAFIDPDALPFVVWFLVPIGVFGACGALFALLAARLAVSKGSGHAT